MARNHLVALAFGLTALTGWAAAAGAQSFPTPPGIIPGAAASAPQGSVRPNGFGGQDRYGASYPAAPQRAGVQSPPSGTASPVCRRLEAQLTAIDRGGLDPARATQIRRYEDALNRQQTELNRTNERSRRFGCQGGGFFSLFANQAPECTPLNRKVQEMRANIERMQDELQRLQGSDRDRDGQRDVVIDALARNDCGPQYRAAAAHQQRGLFETLFGPGSVMAPPAQPAAPPPGESGTYETVCVRTCDGFYFPISFSTVPSRFAEDAQACQRLCPAAQAELFAFHNPGGNINQATSINGTPYTQLPNAFLYRKQYSAACSCKRLGQTWAQALQNLDDTVQRGDIVVTDERAKQMSQPQKPSAPRRKASGTPDTAATPAAAKPATASAAAPSASPGSGERKIRSVGPVFIPSNQ